MLIFRMIAKSSFPEMRRMLAGPEMAALLVKAWPKIQWEVTKEDRLHLKYMAARYLDGSLARDFTPSTSLVEATQQYRADMRWMELFHSTATHDVEVQHENGEWWVYNLIVEGYPRFVRGWDGRYRPRLKSMAAMAELMGWVMADPFCTGTPAIFNRGLCNKSGRKHRR